VGHDPAVRRLCVQQEPRRRVRPDLVAAGVNESALRFAAVGNDIRLGMGAVRNVGGNVVESIIKTREEKGKYATFTDFLDKSELVARNKRVIESLIKAGGFDSLGNTRLSMVQAHEDAVEAGSRSSASKLWASSTCSARVTTRRSPSRRRRLSRT
jgi:DNA polymerase III alpha subunit